MPPAPGCWDGGDGRELLAATLVQNGVGVGLYIVLSSLPGPRGGPGECAAVVRINGGELGAGAGCGFTPEILVDDVRSCCDGIPFATFSDGPFFNCRRRGCQNRSS